MKTTIYTKERITYSKKLLAEILGISRSKLQDLLNNQYFEGLKKLGYQKKQRILSIKQINFIKEMYGDWDENFDEDFDED